MTDLEHLAAKWQRKHGRPHNAHRVKPIPPLPTRTRLRLTLEHRIDSIGARLCHTRPGAHVAEWLWRACRMW